MDYSEDVLNEAKISAADLIAEINLLWGDLYEGEFHHENGVITYFMPNGQIFKISAQAV